MIVLNEGQPNARLLVSFDLKGLFEKPSMIAKHLGLNDHDTGQRGSNNVHGVVSASKTCCKYWP